MEIIITRFKTNYKLIILFLVVIICLLFCSYYRSYAQSKIWEDSFNGGVSTGGYSPEYQSGGEGKFEIFVKKGSTIRKAFLIAGRFGDAKPLSITMNGKVYLFDKNNMATREFESRSYGGPSCVHVLEVTPDINPDVKEYTIKVPEQGGPQKRYNDFCLFVAYENNDLDKVNTAIFLRTTDISFHDKFNISLLVPIQKSTDIAISLFCGYICNKEGDGENVFLDGNKLGQLKGNDSNSGYCGGPLGSFYYENNKLYALEDDNIDRKVDGSDALINAKGLLKDKCKNFTMDFEIDKSVYIQHETNSIWGVIVTYGTEDCKVENVTLTDEQNICQGKSVKLTASGGTRYLWSTGERKRSIIVKPEVSTQYYVTITKGDCYEIDSVGVGVFNTASVNAGNDTTIAFGTNTTLKVFGVGTFNWSTGDNMQSIVVSPKRTTTYTVTVSSGECSAVDKVVVNVANNIKAYTGADTSICIGSELMLKASGGENYLWSTGEKTQSIIVKPNVATTYLVTASIDNNTATDEIYVDVVDLSKANAGNDTTICAGSAITLKAIGGSRYKWSNDEKTPSITVWPKNTTTYSVTISSGGCNVTDNVKVNVLMVPTIEAGNNFTILSDSFAVINLKGPDGKYRWQPESGLSCIDCKNPTVTPDSTTNYFVEYTAENGCKTSDTITIHSKEHHAYYVTNPITPNGDGENDLFMISLRRGKLLDYSILDNKDRLIFRSSIDKYSWDGKYKGEDMPSGVYIYHLNYIDEKGKRIEKTGTFYLIR